MRRPKKSDWAGLVRIAPARPRALPCVSAALMDEEYFPRFYPAEIILNEQHTAKDETSRPFCVWAGCLEFDDISPFARPPLRYKLKGRWPPLISPPLPKHKPLRDNIVCNGHQPLAELFTSDHISRRIPVNNWASQRGHQVGFRKFVSNFP